MFELHTYSKHVRAPFTFLPHFPPWQHFCISIECIFNGILIAIGAVIAIFSLIAAKNTALRMARTPVRATTHTPTHTRITFGFYVAKAETLRKLGYIPNKSSAELEEGEGR